MKIYRVGGAVRDQLMGRQCVDVDYVVTGATPEQMLVLGYEQVGASFPVFLHPETREEYALARTETKTGQGYLGFTCNTTNLNPELTQRFVDLGYDLDAEYDTQHLVRIFQSMRQPK